MDNLGEMYVNTITKFGADITITVTAPSRTINLRLFRTAQLGSFISFNSDLIICLRYLSTPRYLISSASPNRKRSIHPSAPAAYILHSAVPHILSTAEMRKAIIFLPTVCVVVLTSTSKMPLIYYPLTRSRHQSSNQTPRKQNKSPAAQCNL